MVAELVVRVGEGILMVLGILVHFSQPVMTSVKCSVNQWNGHSGRA